ncbi:MAG: rhomboid family intramembrane serine protease [Candidatus Nanopelagicales bacterium]
MRVLPVFILAGLMWLLEIIDAILPADLDQYGIESREADGLTGVVAAPFLHADFAHLMANTVPFLILGCLVALRFGRFGGPSRPPSRWAVESGYGWSARRTRSPSAPAAWCSVT